MIEFSTKKRNELDLYLDVPLAVQLESSLLHIESVSLHGLYALDKRLFNENENPREDEYSKVRSGWSETRTC